MEAHEDRRFQNDGGADQTARPHEKRADAGDEPVSLAEVGGASAGAIEDQELLLDEYRLSHDGTCAARLVELMMRHLDGDASAQRHIARAVNLTHAAVTNRRLILVRNQPLP